jgi:hypothetical protein
MTSKLRRTIVGVGIALGGAVPACFGQSQTGDTRREPDDAHADGDVPDASSSEAAATDAATDRSAVTDAALDASTDATIDAALDVVTDAALDASTDATIDAADPFCDVSWPPTKGNPTPGTVPCVDPLGECTDAWPPWRCYEMPSPGTCLGEHDRVGPLYCIGGQWLCPPGSDDGQRCECWPLPDGSGCNDAGGSGGTSGTGGTSGIEGGAGAN